MNRPPRRPWSAVPLFALLVAGAALSGRAVPAAAQGLPCSNYPSAGPTPSAVGLDMTAVTCFSGFNLFSCCPFQLNAVAPVVAVIDSRLPQPVNNFQPATGQNWCAPSFHGPADSWNNVNLGQVFGITIDDKSPPNIFVAASTVYGSNVPGATPNTSPLPVSPFGPGGAGAVYRLDGATGAISVWAQLPNSGPGLGNLSFDPTSQHFFVSNFEDGRIYNLVDNAGTAQCVQTFDHATGLVTAGSAGVCAPEVGDAPGFAPLGARPWAVRAHGGRLYYGLWVEDLARVNATRTNEVWSIALAAGQYAGAAQAELVNVPPAPANPNRSGPIADLSFSSAGRMMLAERGMMDDIGPGMAGGIGAHVSRNLEYQWNGLAWVPSGRTFGIGAYSSGTNSAGGNDFDCADNLLATGDALLFGGNPSSPIYGLQRTPANGNLGTIPSIQSTGYFIDFDGIGTTMSKQQIGDVVTRRSCGGPTPTPTPGCASLKPGKVSCEIGPNGATGCYFITFTIVNTSAYPIGFLDFPDTHISPGSLTLTPLLGPNQSRTVTVKLCGVPPGPYTLSLLPALVGTDPCCPVVNLTLTLPRCLINPNVPQRPPADPSVGGGGVDGLVAWVRHLFAAPFPSASSQDRYAPAELRACVSPPPGLSAWWPLDEPSGTTANDLIGSNAGTVQGGAAAVTGFVAGARSFDGIDDAIAAPSAPALNFGTGDFTIDAWIWITTSTGTKPIVAKQFAPADAPLGYALLLESGALSFNISNATSTAGTTAPSTLSTGAWHLVAVTMQRGQPQGGKLYADGQLIATFADTLGGNVDTTAEFLIGKRNTLGRGLPSLFFHGLIDEVEVALRALTAAEIIAIFEAGADGKCKGPTPTPTRTSTPFQEITRTPTRTSTPIPEITRPPTYTPTPTATLFQEVTRTPTSTATQFSEVTRTPTPTQFHEFTSTPTNSPTATECPPGVICRTPTPTPTVSPTPRPTEPCLRVDDLTIQCVGGQPTYYTLQLQFVNTSGFTVEHLFIHPLNPGVTVSPNHFGGLGLTPGNGIGLIPITVQTNAVAGTQICLQLVVHDAKFKACCSQQICFTLPNCATLAPPEGVHVGWDRRYCTSKPSVIVPVTICNHSNRAYSYDITGFAPLPAGAAEGCNTDPGVLGFTIFDTPVVVPPGQCRTVRVEVSHPWGLDAPAQVACYRVTVQNQGTGSTFVADGSLLGPADPWCVDVPAAPGSGSAGSGGAGGGGAGGLFWPLPPNSPRAVAFRVTNARDTAGRLGYTLRAVRSDMKGPNTAVSLNRLAAGVDVTGTLALAAGASGMISATVSMARTATRDPFDFHDLVLLADVDGDGAREPLSSIGVGRLGAQRIYLPACGMRVLRPALR